MITEMTNTVLKIEETILEHGSRGMSLISKFLTKGYCFRAAELIKNNKGTVLIGTGFPAAGSFETDGPPGAIALYKVLEYLGYKPVFVFAPPIFNALKHSFRTFEFPILDWPQSVPFVKSALKELKPSLVISIERAGAAEDKRYYNMRKVDITHLVSKYDLFLEYGGCPTIGIGDGGNEIGMGNIHKELTALPIIPSVTKCTELVIASVSNWGVYGIIAAMSLLEKNNLFRLFEIPEIMEFIINKGSVDGINHLAEYTEDGFPLEVGLKIKDRLESMVIEHL